VCCLNSDGQFPRNGIQKHRQGHYQHGGGGVAPVIAKHCCVSGDLDGCNHTNSHIQARQYPLLYLLVSVSDSWTERNKGSGWTALSACALKCDIIVRIQLPLLRLAVGINGAFYVHTVHLWKSFNSHVTCLTPTDIWHRNNIPKHQPSYVKSWHRNNTTIHTSSSHTRS